MAWLGNRSRAINFPAFFLKVNFYREKAPFLDLHLQAFNKSCPLFIPLFTERLLPIHYVAEHSVLVRV